MKRRGFLALVAAGVPIATVRSLYAVEPDIPAPIAPESVLDNAQRPICQWSADGMRIEIGEPWPLDPGAKAKVYVEQFGDELLVCDGVLYSVRIRSAMCDFFYCNLAFKGGDVEVEAELICDNDGIPTELVRWKVSHTAEYMNLVENMRRDTLWRS